MSLKNKLARLKPHLSTNTEEVQNQPSAAAVSNQEIPYLQQWEEEAVKPYFFDGNYCLIREVVYPLSQKHGSYHFSDFLKAVEIWNHSEVNHPLSARGHLPGELFFFDTETTGLGGGVGNTIFLLGYASVVADKLVLRQHILPNPGAEVPLYQSFLEKVNYKTLVTYNGKSFDWPQVKTRHTLVREHVPKLPQFGHFDLYHAARRLWKHKLERLKLAVVEKEVLGVERIDDIPGFLAPMIYFDFIDSGQPTGMLGILKHNEIDILSLVSLYTHLTFQICGYDPSRSRRESYEIGRWFAHLGEGEEAEKMFRTLAEGKDVTSFQAKLKLAFHQKKAQKWDVALPLFTEVADQAASDLCVIACVEAAKIYEHKLKNYPLAIRYSQKAADELDPNDSNSQKQQKELEIRLTRLENKQRKFPG